MENKYKPGIKFIIYEVITTAAMLASIKEQGVGFALFGIVFYSLVGFAVSHSSWKKKVQFDAMSPEEKELYLTEEKAKKDAADKAAREKRTIASVQILDSNHNYKTKGSLTSAAIRGTVGAAVAGPVGAVIGASTHKKKTVGKGSTTRFLIEYQDGHKITKEVKVDSAEYKRLIQYL